MSNAVVVFFVVLNSVPPPAAVWNIVSVVLDVPNVVRAWVCLLVAITVE